MARASRDKGKRGEYEVRDLIRGAGFACERTPGSGGLFVKGDLHDGDGGLAVPGVHFEVKRCEAWAMPAWLRQAYADAPMGAAPAVVFRRSKSKGDPCGEWHAAVPFAWLLNLLKNGGTDGR